MEPQTMTEQAFFLALCSEFGLDAQYSDERSIFRAIHALKQELNATDMALAIVQAQVASLEAQIDRLDNEED